MGLVPATSPCNKSQGLVALCELATSPCGLSQGPVASCQLAIFASESSRRTKFWVPATRFCGKNGQFTRCD